MRILSLIFVLFFMLDAFAVRIECTTKLTKGRTDDITPRETWCGPINMNIADNGVKYRKKTSRCGKILVELFSIKSNNEEKFVKNCQKIYRRDCYMVGIKDTSKREGLGFLSSHVIFESTKKMPNTFNVSAHAYGRNMGLPQPGIRSWLDLNCRVRH